MDIFIAACCNCLLRALIKEISYYWYSCTISFIEKGVNSVTVWWQFW